jgi:formylglycine-generating enzyme required for sulfatase activity
MIASLQVRDSLGVRRVERADFPLALGGSGCAVVLDPALSQPVGWIGLHDEALFLQPAGASQLLHNGVAVERSSWLHTGDVISAGSSVLKLLSEDGIRTLAVGDAGPGNVTAPPVIERRDVLSGADEGNAEALTSIRYRAQQEVVRTPVRRRGKAAIIAVAALLVAFTLWFLAAGVAVQLGVQPGAARFDVDGNWLKVRVGSQLFARPGKYTLHASAPGYRSQQLDFVVSDKQGQAVALQLSKLPGKLRVEVPVAGALRIDAGIALAVPGEIEVPAGKHKLELAVAGYLPYAGEIEIQGLGKSQSLKPSLVLNSALVAITTEPGNAQVLIDGKPLGTTPLERRVDAGTHPLELRLSGFKPWTTDLLVKANEAQTLGPIRLGLPDATLMVRSNPTGARVTVGGVYRGLAPLKLVLRAENNTVLSLSLPGHTDAQRSLRFGPGAHEEINVALTPILGTVRLRTSPSDAEVWVDGVKHGQGLDSITLSAVMHQVEIRKGGFVSVKYDVTPRAGFEQLLETTLGTESQLKVARFPATVKADGSVELRLMPVGKFVMGSPRREPGRRANEGQRPVELQRLFYMGVREITNAEYHRFRAEHKSGMFGGVSLNLDNQPVVQVTWQDAAAYCNWLSKQEGIPAAYQQQGGDLVPVSPMNTGYRLPSEAEWEWVARAQRGGRYPWGDELPVAPNSGNYADVSASTPLQDVIAGYNDGFVASAPVGSFAASALGLHDLGGNVSEWTTDLYATSYSVEATALDPMYLAAGNQHATRGASWRTSTAAELRLAARAAGTAARDDLGFRIARYAE